MGAMNVKCIYYYTLFWQKEHNIINYYKKGEIVLPPIREPPDLLKRLLTRDYLISDSFFKNIRQYNSILAFIFIAYTLNRRLGASKYNLIF
jgi:hypothetical protein